METKIKIIKNVPNTFYHLLMLLYNSFNFLIVIKTLQIDFELLLFIGLVIKNLLLLVGETLYFFLNDNKIKKKKLEIKKIKNNE